MNLPIIFLLNWFIVEKCLLEFPTVQADIFKCLQNLQNPAKKDILFTIMRDKEKSENPHICLAFLL